MFLLMMFLFKILLLFSSKLCLHIWVQSDELSSTPFLLLRKHEEATVTCPANKQRKVHCDSTRARRRRLRHLFIPTNINSAFTWHIALPYHNITTEIHIADSDQPNCRSPNP